MNKDKKLRKQVKIELYLKDGVDPSSYTDRELDEEFMDYINDDGMISELSDQDKEDEMSLGNEKTGTDSDHQD